MTVDELIKAQEILENGKKTIICNANVAKVLEKNDIGRNLKIVISEWVSDNQCLLYD